MSVREAEPVTPPPTVDRRGFVTRAGLAAVGAAAAAPVVGSTSARAAGSSPAYTNASNTFTAVQQVNARLGIRTTPNYPLHVVRTDPGSAVRVDAHTMALELDHDTAWAGQTYDLVNLYHRSAGDAIFIAHQGGKPLGFTGVTGGNAALNVLVPYTLDDTGDGRGGSVVNAHTGMRGLHVETQAVVADSNAINVQHFGNDYAMYMGVQLPQPGQPVGTGGALYIDDQGSPSTLYMNVNPPAGGARDAAAIRIDDYSSVSGIRVDKWVAPATSSDALMNLIGRTNNPMQAITVRDANFGQRFRVDTDGQIATYDASGTLRMNVSPAGRAAFGSAMQFSVQMQVIADGSGVQHTLALINQDPSAAAGTTLEFDDASAQYALIAAGYDARAVGSRSASLSFQVRSSDRLTERLRLDGTGIGFFGATPVARPVVTGSRDGTPALASLLAALSKVGLVTDSTTA
jgi:hypothetical protein